MRIKIDDHGRKTAIFVDEIQVSEEGDAICLPKMGKKIMTGGLTDALFTKLLKEGWADLSGFQIKRYHQEVLL